MGMVAHPNDLPVVREYPAVEGILNAFKILSDTRLHFDNKKVHKVILDKVQSEILTVSFDLYDIDGHIIGQAFIRRV